MLIFFGGATGILTRLDTRSTVQNSTQEVMKSGLKCSGLITRKLRTFWTIMTTSLKHPIGSYLFMVAGPAQMAGLPGLLAFLLILKPLTISKAKALARAHLSAQMQMLGRFPTATPTTPNRGMPTQSPIFLVPGWRTVRSRIVSTWRQIRPWLPVLSCRFPTVLCGLFTERATLGGTSINRQSETS